MREINASNYSIWIGDKSLSNLDTSCYSKIAILLDENTKKYCLNKIPEIKNVILIEIKSGEKNKNIEICNFIWGILLKNNFDRNSLIINLGGGVIGDIGGFCASTYKRGIDFIHIPTTLLAMVDASIGGKLGVNFSTFKNQIGIFKNPKYIIINPKFLQSLPEDHLKSGFAEVIKHALIADKKLWKKITSTPFSQLNWNEIIPLSIQIKNKIVLADPFEKGERKKLNFGHTYGHAIESYYLKKGTKILHGEAVLMGIILESELSKICLTEKNEIKNFILSNFQLPTIPLKKEILFYLRNDKKNSNNKINFTLLSSIGKSTINNLFFENDL